MKGYSPSKCGDFIPVQNVYENGSTFHRMDVSNLINTSGSSGKINKSDTHHNSSSGKDMWLTYETSGDIHLIFDLGATYPLGEMWVWNYNQNHLYYSNLFRRGVKEIKIDYSLDQNNWTELRGEGYPYRLAMADGSKKLQATNLDDGIHSPIKFNHCLARYVRLSVEATPGIGNWGGYDGNEPLYGLSHIRFYAGTGLAAIPSKNWTDLFHQTKGWSGADGIYSIPFNGDKEFSKDKTIFIFGDTFIGTVDEATNNRLESQMINNSLGILNGAKPDLNALQFRWNQDSSHRRYVLLFAYDNRSESQSTGRVSV